MTSDPRATHLADRFDGLTRRPVFDFDFVDARDLSPVIDALLEPDSASRAVTLGKLPLVVTPNVDHIVLLRNGSVSPAAADVVHRAAWVLPDGQPIVWASRLLGHRLSARLPGSGLVESLWPKLRERGQRVLVVAPNAKTVSLIEADDVDAVVLEAPMIGTDAEAARRFAAECVSRLPEGGVPFVFVALGFPVQCLVARELLDAWPADATPPVVLCVGAAFEMMYGLRRRAPRWVQVAGIEWLFRLVQEPRRLARRYVLRDPKFIVYVWREWRKGRGRS